MAVDATSGVGDVEQSSGAGDRDRPDTGAIRESANRVPEGQVAQASQTLGGGQGDNYQNSGSGQGSGNVQMAQASTLVMPRFAPAIPRTGPMEIPARPSITGPGTADNVLENRGDKLKGKWEDRAVHKGKQDGGATPGGPENENPDEDYRDQKEDGYDKARKERDMNDRSKQRDFQRRMKDGLRGIMDWFTRPPPMDMGPIA